jgi:two-component system, NtrC family, response regulator HydG
MLTHVVLRMTGETAEDLVQRVHEVIERDVGPNYPWPGNVRELEQAVRRILLTNRYPDDQGTASRGDRLGHMASAMEAGALEAREMVAAYCVMLYDRFGTYEEVSRRIGFDRRTVKKHTQRAASPSALANRS